MENNLVSVIIPAYNHENYVQETIRSIIAQTYQNIEIIVIDDGSKDSTWQKIEEMRKECDNRFVNVYFETKNNEGTCATLNKLIAKAKGKYVYLIASDDLAKPKAIETEALFLDNNPDYVLAVGDNDLIDASSNIIGWDQKQHSVAVDGAYFKTFGSYIRYHYKDIDFMSDKFGSYETFVRRNYVPNGYLIRSEALHKMGKFTKEAPLEDWYMHLQLSKLGKYKYLDEVLFSYRWHDNNTVQKSEYMKMISLKTQLYEENLVNSLADKKWKEIFDNNVNEVKMKFNIGNFIKFYRLKRLSSKKHILEILGHQYQISPLLKKKTV